ncbi:hypothetical protein NDU88_002597 [Pleurodeles waltl]|uniref:Uncharacterized protein n=1 Tax=Pleurodeles waltl TaxID=8319 RepID=A0AAV7KWJ8_PLEWA|nr:hypothetical protein NDU88_002597 [Pleurodeles waltl]
MATVHLNWKGDDETITVVVIPNLGEDLILGTDYVDFTSLLEKAGQEHEHLYQPLARRSVFDGPARCGPCTNPTCAGAATSVPATHAEEADQGSHLVTKAGLRRVERPVVVRRNAHNGGAVSSGAGGRNGAHQRKQEGEEEADGGTDISASQEA